ncbi:Fic family protein [Sphingomonas sp. NCPPB 2930]
MFDPFNDFQTAGYLRNVEGLKDPQRIKFEENFFFETRLEDALSQLRRRRGKLEYRDFLRVHETLFSDFYPWAGRDRHQLGVARMVSKGPQVQFEVSEQCRQAVEWGLRLGNDADRMRACPGEVMGAFAWGHPFLDGNGRAMLLVHSELCHRAGFAIDWIASDKAAYLTALTHELNAPQDRELDKYFSALITEYRPRDDWVNYFKSIPGLSGMDEEQEHVEYQDGDSEALARYEEVKRRRDEQMAADEPDIGGTHGAHRTHRR